MELEELAREVKTLQSRYLNLYAQQDMIEGVKIEKEYLAKRQKLLEEIDTEIKRERSIKFTAVIERNKRKTKQPKRETGIYSLDRELVTAKEYGLGKVGGFTLGNFIQFAGERGAGKSTILTKMLAAISNGEPIGWFDFEMGEEKAEEMMNNFDYTAKNIYYYQSSRELSDIVDEIKILATLGVKHFLVDSMMKIDAKGYKRGYESFSYISSEFARLTTNLNINIYLINQMSSESQKTNTLMMKHGNDAEYDADYIFFVVKKKLKEKDEAGQPKIDDNARIIVCNKNRVDHRTFAVEIPKSEIFGIKAVEVEYQIDMPTV